MLPVRLNEARPNSCLTAPHEALILSNHSSKQVPQAHAKACCQGKMASARRAEFTAACPWLMIAEQTNSAWGEVNVAELLTWLSGERGVCVEGSGGLARGAEVCAELDEDAC